MPKTELQKYLFAKEDAPFVYRFLRKPQGDLADMEGARKTDGIVDKLFADENGKVDELAAAEFSDSMLGLLRMLEDGGYDLHALFKTLNHGDFFQNVESLTQGSFKLAMAEAVGKTLPEGVYKPGAEYENLIKDFTKIITEKFDEEAVPYSKRQVDSLVHDLFGKSLHTGNVKKLNRLTNELRGAYNFFQLGPLSLLWGGITGALFLTQSFVVGIPHYVSRRMSAKNVIDHALTDYLMYERNVMGSAKVADVEQQVFEDAFQTYSYKALNALFNNRFLNKAIDKLPGGYLKQAGKDFKEEAFTVFH